LKNNVNVSAKSRVGVLLALFFGSSLAAFAQQSDSDRAQIDAEGMSAFIASQMRTFDIPGAAVGITHGDQIVYVHGFGTADPSGHPITPESLFLIGSNSKAFTALAVMQLVEAGTVNLDDPIQKYLPWFRLKTEAAPKPITVRHLLNNTSGLPRLDWFAAPDTNDHEIAAGEYEAELSEVKQAKPAGAAFEYSDAGYEILGMLIETVTHESYAAYVKKHVLEPLNMHSTFLTYEGAESYGLVNAFQYWFGLTRRLPTPPYSPYLVPVGNIASTAENMCHFLIAQLNGGFYNGHSVISPTSLAIMHTPRKRIGSAYGMGWFIESWDGMKSFNHLGINPNFSSLVNILPEEKYGIVLLMNANSFSITGQTNLVDAIIRRLQGEQNISYWPEELFQRLLLLFLLVLGFVLLVRMFLRWHSMGYPLTFHFTRRVGLTIAIGGAVILAFLIGIPIYGESAIVELLDVQPDIGYGLIAGAVIAAIHTALSVFCLSRSAYLDMERMS
jgi:CubicO group peptidase (beta-lactamase class C family)